MRKILFVGPCGLCGISTVHQNVLKLVGEGKNLQFSNLDTVPYRKRNKIIGYITLYGRASFEILRQWPDVVYLQISQTGYLHQSIVLLIAKLLGRKTTAHFHAHPNLRERAGEKNFGIICRSRWFVDQFIVLSKYSKEDLVSGGCDADKVSVIPNFLDGRDYPTSPVAWEDKRHILYIGRMIQAKGIFQVLEIARILDDEHFVMFGPFESVELEAEFQEAANDVPNLEWKGPISGKDKIPWIASAKMTILPSQSEVFPMSVLESSFCQTASAITAVGMVPEVMDDGVDGIFLEWNAASRNAEKMRKWLMDPAKLGQLAARARKRAESLYSLDGVRDSFRKVFEV